MTGQTLLASKPSAEGFSLCTVKWRCAGLGRSRGLALEDGSPPSHVARAVLLPLLLPPVCASFPPLPLSPAPACGRCSGWGHRDGRRSSLLLF